MQISFDPRDAQACHATLAAIFALHPNIAESFPVGVLEEFDEGGSQGDRLLPDAVDAAEAFDGASAEQAFAAAPAPVAAPVAAPPVAAAPAPVAAPAGVDVDKSGLPWDGRIHSGPADKKPKNSDGTWRKKRGVDDATVAAVEAELRQVMAAPAPAAIPAPPVAAAPEVAAAPVPPPPAVPVAAPPPPVPAAEAPTAAPIAPPPTPAAAAAEPGPAVATAAPSPAPAPVAGPAANFADLMRKITGLQTAGTLTVDGTRQIAESLGITGVRDLMSRPDLIPSFDALLPA